MSVCLCGVCVCVCVRERERERERLFGTILQKYTPKLSLPFPPPTPPSPFPQGLPMPELLQLYPPVCPPFTTTTSLPRGEGIEEDGGRGAGEEMDRDYVGSSGGRGGGGGGGGVVIDCEGLGPAVYVRDRYERRVTDGCSGEIGARYM